MPIITQLNATKLRSLKYGNDTSNGGNSGQPYMKVELKDVDKPFNRFRLTKFDDGLIRGGAIGALNASVVDTLRIGKFLKDFPKGPLFIVKQVGLQLSNPKLETKKGLSGLLGKVGSTRLYNLGINTLAQVPLNAFGGHLMRHGLLPVMDESTKYINVVTENNREVNNAAGSMFSMAGAVGNFINPSGGNNRLVGLTNKFNLGDNEGDITEQFNLPEARRANRQANRQGRQANRAANQQRRQDTRAINQSLRQGARTEGFEFERYSTDRIRFKRNKLDTKTLTIDSYNGGPKSVYGIGRTIINRYVFTEDINRINESFAKSKIRTTQGSLAVNPLTTPSIFENSSGSYFTASIAEPISEPATIFANIKENNQFNVLGRKFKPNRFIYGTYTPESWLVPENSLINNDALKEIKAPSINPVIDTPSDKFKVIKTGKETTDYTNGTRTVDNDLKITSGAGQVGDKTPTRAVYTGKTQAEVDAKQNANSIISTKAKPRALDEATVKSTRKKRQVKASIVNVDGMEGGLETTYTSGEMAKFPKTEISNVTAGGGLFETQNVPVNRSIDKNNNSFLYLNDQNKVPQFNRIDQAIMQIKFDTINPFTAAKERTVVFSAYMSGFKYNSNSTWNPVKYVGRSESFYIFTEHKREVSFNLQIPCFNRVHLLEKHRALSELQSAGAGKYDKNNRLGGVITKITLGNYLVNEPGILTSISFDIPDTSTWDIDEKLAMYINAQFSFIVIGKDLPEYKEGGFLSYLTNPLVGTGFLTGLANAR